jgi:hypothetical protein
MKRAAFLLLFILISCSSKKQILLPYHSEKLCRGIDAMTQHIKNSDYIKQYYSEVKNQVFDVDTILLEGIPLPFLQSEIANIISEKEGIPQVEAAQRIEYKYLGHPNTILISDCIKGVKDPSAKLKISYLYIPEYSLLSALISKTNYAKEYNKGLAFLVKINDEGVIEIIKTTEWVE